MWVALHLDGHSFKFDLNGRNLYIPEAFELMKKKDQEILELQGKLKADRSSEQIQQQPKKSGWGSVFGNWS